MAINKNDYLDGDGNYDLKKELVDELIDEANDVIESGSTSNSSWVTFPDGTLIQSGRHTSTGEISQAVGAMYKYPTGKNITILSSFVERPVISLTLEQGHGAGYAMTAYIEHADSEFFRYNVMSTNTLGNYNVFIHWVAVGRWK